jgi:cytochrome c553
MPPAGPPVPWRQMAKDQKGKYMKEVVMPKMQALFAAHDPEEFGTITCKTCHGEDGKERGFEMPSPSLYVLPATAAEFAALREKHPKMMKFMGEVVKPQMAALLGLPEFKPDAPQPDAFGCKACHTSKTP